MEFEVERISGWIETLVKRPDEIADIFLEERRELALEWRDGEVRHACASSEGGAAARLKNRSSERLAFISRADEVGAREAVRSLQASVGRPPLPLKTGSGKATAGERPPLAADRWLRRLPTLFARHASRHRFRWVLTDVARQVIPARGAACSSSRRLVSLEGAFTAASRRGDETRAFSFHAPDGEDAWDALRTALALAGAPRDPRVPCGTGETDVVLANGCAALLFHEILSHPLESEAESPLSGLEQARLAVAELEVRDDPTRLDLFGGYERDDEGMPPKPVKLLDGGRLAGRLTDRARAAPSPSNGHARRAGPADLPLVRGSNLLVAGGHATSDEMARRLGSGVWIERFDGGSVELASGRFRLRFPRARRVRRGQLADELGPGVLAGDILGALKSIEPALGREVRVDRSLGWCSRRGQVVAVQGAAPDVLIRKLAIRPA